MVADQRGAFCCQGGGFRRALGAAQRDFATTGPGPWRLHAPHRGDRFARRALAEREELGLLVPLG